MKKLGVHFSLLYDLPQIYFSKTISFIQSLHYYSLNEMSYYSLFKIYNKLNFDELLYIVVYLSLTRVITPLVVN